MHEEIDPMSTPRAMSYEYFIDAPQPTVTVIKTFDITKLLRFGKRHGYRTNMLMCHCIMRAASGIPEFWTVLKGKKFFKYDRMGVDVIVKNRDGGLGYCDIPYRVDIDEFDADYRRLTAETVEACEHRMDEDLAIIGTSAVVNCEVDGIVNMYSGMFSNPFMAWGRYSDGLFRKRLRVSFQFHHVQMDGEQACDFLARLQRCIDTPGETTNGG